MSEQDPGRPFSMTEDLPHAGGGGETEVILINNSEDDLRPGVYFVDIEVQHVGAANPLDYVSIGWKDPDTLAFQLLLSKSAAYTAAMYQWPTDAGRHLVARYSRAAAGAAEGRLIITGAMK